MGGLLGALASFLNLTTGLGAYVWPMIIGIAIGIVVAAILIRMKQKEEQQRMTQDLNS
jgi:predicted small secreted protein